MILLKSNSVPFKLIFILFFLHFYLSETVPFLSDDVYSYKMQYEVRTPPVCVSCRIFMLVMKLKSVTGTLTSIIFWHKSEIKKKNVHVSHLNSLNTVTFFFLYDGVWRQRWRDIHVKSVDETSRPSTSSQKPAPLRGSVVTNQAEDLLINRVRKWGAGGGSCAEGWSAGAKPRW